MEIKGKKEGKNCNNEKDLTSANYQLQQSPVLRSCCEGKGKVEE